MCASTRFICHSKQRSLVVVFLPTKLVIYTVHNPKSIASHRHHAAPGQWLPSDSPPPVKSLQSGHTPTHPTRRMNRRTQFAVLHQSRLEALASCSGPCKYPPVLASGAVCHVPAIYYIYKLTVASPLTFVHCPCHLHTRQTTYILIYPSFTHPARLRVVRTTSHLLDTLAPILSLCTTYLALISLLPSFAA